jgi:ubiquinone/menaquinone biosynthesis C-methylase UbiE
MILIDAIAANPIISDVCRWLLEAGFKGEKSVLQKELPAIYERILDMGCGTGMMTSLFSPVNYSGIDPNQKHISWARKKHPHYRFMVMDGRNTGFQSDAFDVILIGGVIHHLNNADGNAILKEACRVLKPRGKLIIWEDIPALNDANIIGRLIHRLDDGDHIRSAAQYIDIVKTYFSITKEYTMTSGVCDYIVITGQKY